MDKPRSITQRYFRYVIRRLRQDRNLTQDQLSERIGISTGFLGMMEIGRKWPNIDMLFRIAAALDVRPGELLDELEREARK